MNHFDCAKLFSDARCVRARRTPTYATPAIWIRISVRDLSYDALNSRSIHERSQGKMGETTSSQIQSLFWLNSHCTSLSSSKPCTWNNESKQMNKLNGRCERASLNRLRNISDFQSNFNQTRVQSNEVQKRCSSHTITESIFFIETFTSKKSHRLSTSHITINKRKFLCVCFVFVSSFMAHSTREKWKQKKYSN